MKIIKNNSFSNSFSLNEISKPKFTSNQICADETTINTGLPKIPHRLVVKKSGKIVYSK